jgi:hypothetical protein
MSKVQVFVSFDCEHDKGLYELLREQSRSAGSPFDVSGGSERMSQAPGWGENARRRIGGVDQVIVICGEHTEESAGVLAELAIVKEVQKPYFLLWGRREVMCTKPAGSKPADGMYSWTQQIVTDQIAINVRNKDTDATAKTLSTAARKVSPA